MFRETCHAHAHAHAHTLQGEKANKQQMLETPGTPLLTVDAIVMPHLHTHPQKRKQILSHGPSNEISGGYVYLTCLHTSRSPLARKKTEIKDNICTHITNIHTTKNFDSGHALRLSNSDSDQRPAARTVAFQQRQQPATSCKQQQHYTTATISTGYCTAATNTPATATSNNYHDTNAPP